MKGLSVLALAFLAACGALLLDSQISLKGNAPVEFEDGWPYTRAPNFPFGTWTSSSGYRIELRENNTYRVCLEACDEGIYEHQGTGINLRDFNVPEKPVAQRLITLVNSDGRRGRDLNFTPNMGPPANAEDCGGRPCVQLGAWSPRHEYTFILQQ